MIGTFSVGGKDSVTPAGQRQAVLLSCFPLPVPLFLTAAALSASQRTREQERYFGTIGGK